MRKIIKKLKDSILNAVLLLVAFCFLFSGCGGGGGGTPVTTTPLTTTTKLFLRYDSVDYLSTEQTPSVGYEITNQNCLYSYNLSPSSPLEWRAILGNGIEGKTYSFSLWLVAANYPSGSFKVSLIVRHNGVETELAKTEFTVPYSIAEIYEKFSATVEGQSGGVAGDELILRITFTGSRYGDKGCVIFGSSESTDSHIVIPGNITVSKPSS